MRYFDKIVKEGQWDAFLKDWIERRDNLKYTREANYSAYLGNYEEEREHRDEHYQMLGGYIYRVRAKNRTNNSLNEIHILTATKRGNNYPIVCLIKESSDWEKVEEFDCRGISKSGQYELFGESLHFDLGDYVVTKGNSIGIYFNSTYLLCGIDKENREHLDLFGGGDYALRMATEEEKELVDKMLSRNKRVWNKETRKLEVY